MRAFHGAPRGRSAILRGPNGRRRQHCWHRGEQLGVVDASTAERRAQRAPGLRPCAERSTERRRRCRPSSRGVEAVAPTAQCAGRAKVARVCEPDHLAFAAAGRFSGPAVARFCRPARAAGSAFGSEVVASAGRRRGGAYCRGAVPGHEGLARGSPGGQRSGIVTQSVQASSGRRTSFAAAGASIAAAAARAAEARNASPIGADGLPVV
mmetsp:Transcript_102578/g.295395  ORF Transcript_102578/g.295395 Transcript_102578/m.295395 type:complete len:209 (+) Transcript_102578:419-1045(+)